MKSAGATPGAPPPEPWTISLSDFGSILKSIRKTPYISKASDRWDMSSTTTQTREDDHSRVLGIDVGSVSLSVAEINLRREILKTDYRFHHGDVRGALREALNGFDLKEIRWVAATSSTPTILKTNRRYDSRVAIMEAARHFHRNIGSILVVGGEAFGLIGFDGNGKYRSFRSNTSCAAGTGSFLDQQARRLNLESAEALSTRASSNRGTVPKMASRCAVFAKTDLVHAQQEGYSLEQICDGLCHGLARNIVRHAFHGPGGSCPDPFHGRRFQEQGRGPSHRIDHREECRCRRDGHLRSRRRGLSPGRRTSMNRRSTP